jgi:hypothetical protein
VRRCSSSKCIRDSRPRSRDVQDPFDPAVGSALDADHRVDHPADAQAPGLELLGDRVVQERRVGGADLHDGAERLVAVLGTGRFEHTDRRTRPAPVSASSNAPTITPTSSAAGRSARSCGGSRRVNASANARRASARSGGTEASRSSSTGAGRAPAVTSSVVLTMDMVPVPEQAPDLRLRSSFSRARTGRP